MLVKRVSNFIENSSAVGVQNALTLVWNFSFLKKKKCPIIFPGCSNPLYLRESTSDIVLLKQFIPLFYNWKPKRQNIEVVIDAGANIGLFTAMMASRYPQARIIAIEPDRENFEILCENCKPYKNVELVKAALWYKREPLMISNPNATHWERQVESKTNGIGKTIDAVTVSSILENFEVKKVDVFKVDIEGAEGAIFKYGDLSWISAVKELLIELHEVPEIDIKRTFLEILNTFPHTKEELGEYTWLSFL
ncbi:MAG: FkbM family methyltransferase [Xenococcus sp. MO_188.B8]|nr:FkbM family methyltransferase [Xenococcus sp. MO_188.B8]